MRLYRRLKTRKWFLLGVLVPFMFGLMQDKVFSSVPAFFSPAHWRTLWLSSSSELPMSGLVSIMLLSLETVTGGTIACILLSRKTIATTNGTKVNGQNEVIDPILQIESRHFHIS